MLKDVSDILLCTVILFIRKATEFVELAKTNVIYMIITDYGYRNPFFEITKNLYFFILMFEVTMLVDSRN